MCFDLRTDPNFDLRHAHSFTNGIDTCIAIQIYSDLRTDPHRELHPGNRFVTIWNTDPRPDLPRIWILREMYIWIWRPDPDLLF